MPHWNKKSTSAKAQWRGGNQYFPAASAKYFDSASKYATSCAEEVSEVDDPVMVPVQSKNHKHKAVYTKDSEQTKYHKQSYWQMAEEGSGTLTNWVQVSHSPS